MADGESKSERSTSLEFRGSAVIYGCEGRPEVPQRMSLLWESFEIPRGRGEDIRVVFREVESEEGAAITAPFYHNGD